MRWFVSLTSGVTLLLGMAALAAFALTAHGFMRLGEQPDATAANAQARAVAWKVIQRMAAAQ